MDKNKSIDGLAPRRSKKPATSSSRSTKTATKTTAKKTTKPVPKAKTTTKTTPKTLKKSTAKKPTTKKPAKKPVTPEPTDITTTSADFLKPVQAFNFDEQTGELKAAENPAKPAKPKKEKKPISKKRKIITSIILAIVIILIIGVIWLILWGNDIIAKITGGQGNIFDLFTEHYEELKTDKNGRTNILAFGTSGYNMEGEEGNGIHDGAQLTDSIMIISLDQKTGDIAMLSLPRDLKASSTCTATGKINEIYWCNNIEGDDEKAGANALTEEVSSILDIDFQYYAHLNWGSLVQIVDTLGGINVTLDEDIQDYYYTGAVFEAGVPYTINGGQALGLARARHGTTGGDFSRGASQQKILIGIKDKALEKRLSIPEILSLASTLGDNLRTNFSVDEMKTLAHIATAYDLSNMRQVSLIEPEKFMTTGEINGISYVIPIGGTSNYTRIQEYVAKLFSSDPRVYEEPSILVLNATDTPGAASKEKEALTKDGYTNVAAEDAPAGEYEKGYILYVLSDSVKGTTKLLDQKYDAFIKSAEELPAGISTDYDFVLIINN